MMKVGEAANRLSRLQPWMWSSSWRLGGPSHRHRLAADVVIQPRLQAAVGDQVHLAAQHVLEELPESEEPERRCSFGGVHEKVYVGVRCLVPRERAV
jgi:hypothetical protein